VILPVALLAVAGLVAAAVNLTGGPNLTYIAAGLGLPAAYVRYASQAAKKYGVPLQWVLATILVESSGNTRAAGDADRRSVGLMQVNAVAHARELAAAGLTRESLFKPKIGIDWGTKLLAGFAAQVRAALGGRSPPAPLDEITRLAYKGPAPVVNALKRGENPLNLSWAPQAVQNWRSAMARVNAAEARGRALLTRSGPTV
jgi:hypothetical protein